MKKLSKIFALVLAVAMVISVFGACGSKETQREAGKFTYWVSMDSRAQQTLSNYSDMLMYQELAKKTGVEIEFIHPTAGSTGSEAFQILLTQTDLPDMVQYAWSSYPGGADAAIDNKVIIALNDYLEEYAPDYYDYMEGERGKQNDYLYKKELLTTKGRYYGFASLAIGSCRGFCGFYIRKDLLDKWGLDIPTTIDDWSEVFAAAKKDGIKYPLTGGMELITLKYNSTAFNTAWNIAQSYMLDGDKVVFAPNKPEYKEYIKTMADWYKKGYIDPDCITNNADAVLGKITSSESIASFGYIGGGLGKLIPAMAEKNPDFKIAACPYPSLLKGEKSKMQSVSAETTGPAIGITVSCGKNDAQRYVDAVKWCNELYTEDGKILKSFGVEGKTFTKTEKKPEEIGDDGEKYTYTYTSIIADDNDPGRKEIGAHSVEAALYHFMLPGGGPGLNQHPDYLKGFYPYQEQIDALEIWNENIDTAREINFPAVTFTDEEVTRKNELIAKCYDTLDAALTNIIIGKASMDTYDAVVEKANKDGMKEVIEIYQAAYDRYKAQSK